MERSCRACRTAGSARSGGDSAAWGYRRRRGSRGCRRIACAPGPSDRKVQTAPDRAAAAPAPSPVPGQDVCGTCCATWPCLDATRRSERKFRSTTSPLSRLPQRPPSLCERREQRPAPMPPCTMERPPPVSNYRRLAPCRIGRRTPGRWFRYSRVVDIFRPSSRQRLMERLSEAAGAFFVRSRVSHGLRVYSTAGVLRSYKKHWIQESTRRYVLPLPRQVRVAIAIQK